MGTKSRIVQHHMQCILQNYIRHDKWLQLERGPAANQFPLRVMNGGMAELNVLVDFKHLADATATTALWTIFWICIKTLKIVLRHWELPQAPACPGSSQMRLGSGKPLSLKFRTSLWQYAPPDLSHIMISKPANHLCLYPHIWCL